MYIIHMYSIYSINYKVLGCWVAANIYNDVYIYAQMMNTPFTRSSSLHIWPALTDLIGQKNREQAKLFFFRPNHQQYFMPRH